MPEQLDVAIVGAGPYGLSVAAHLPERRVRVFGEPMETWRTRMPPDMLLRSDWDETSLSAPNDAGTIDVWAREAGEPRQNPIPLQTFLRYADWFRGRFVRENDPSNVVELDRAGGRLPARDRRGRRGRCAQGRARRRRHVPSPTRRRRFRDALGDGVSLRDRSAGLTALTRPTGDRGRRWAGRAGERRTRRPRGGGGRADPPVEAALVRGAGAVHPARARCGSGCTGSPIRSSATARRRSTGSPCTRSCSRSCRSACGGGWRAAFSAPADPRGCAAQVDGKVQITEERTVVTLARNDGGLLLGLSDGSRAGGGRGDPLDRVPLLARPAVLPLAGSPRRNRRAATAGRSSTARSARAIRACSSSATPPRTGSARSLASCRAPGSLRTGCVKRSTPRPTLSIAPARHGSRAFLERVASRRTGASRSK